jgi:hypothetical protein
MQICHGVRVVGSPGYRTPNEFAKQLKSPTVNELLEARQFPYGRKLPEMYIKVTATLVYSVDSVVDLRDQVLIAN